MIDILKINPIVTFIYFMSIIMIPMFTNNIILALVSFLVCFLYYKLLDLKIEKNLICFLIFIFLTISILNVLWNHRGATILFFFNDNAITFESLFYGISFSFIIISSVMWFRLVSHFFTSDKLMYIFSKMSLNIALLLTISIRFVDMYVDKFVSIDDSIKGVGYYKDYSILDKIKCKTFVFSALVTWALENGIITADSMTARGYGIGKRTNYYIYKWTKTDKIYLFIVLILNLINVFLLINKSFYIDFYPIININYNLIVYIPFYILISLGIINEFLWRAKWHSMMSKI